MRYAIYYTPHAAHPLSKCVSTWLGRDAFTGDLVQTDHRMGAHLTSARKYGFHGTLKAPFNLADGVREAELIELFDSFAASHQTFTLSKLMLAKLGDFFALVPSEASDALHDLAEDAVRSFEPLRAALSDSDIERRNPSALSARQRANLHRWGYPYVMEEFQFHLTLTDRVDEAHSDAVEAAIRNHFERFIDQPFPIATLGLFVEPARGEPFTVRRIAALS